MSIRVVLAEDSALLRQGVAGLIRSEPDLEVVASCADLPELVEAIGRHRPDVVLTDIRMPPTRTDEGIRAAEHCRAEHPGMGVLLLSQYVDARYVRALLAQGTDGRGYLLKERVADVAELVAAVRTVAGGGSVFDPKVVEALVRGRDRRGNVGLAQLSAREREVLAEMAHGLTNAAIAGALVITQRAVEKHINSIFSKLQLGQEDGVHPRVQAVLTYLAGDAP
ncbi:response regulator transcription factor [Krasilnikovia sp. M28-CT-15]|uniref:response regulator transcription factor n=1 Tax=Krasilnikovia sp. M28-CT-15 TaxID=3373540 RepID=UPI0038774FDD